MSLDKTELFFEITDEIIAINNVDTANFLVVSILIYLIAIYKI